MDSRLRRIDGYGDRCLLDTLAQSWRERKNEGQQESDFYDRLEVARQIICRKSLSQTGHNTQNRVNECYRDFSTLIYPRLSVTPATRWFVWLYDVFDDMHRPVLAAGSCPDGLPLRRPERTTAFPPSIEKKQFHQS
jgi:hypothetical protein